MSEFLHCKTTIKAAHKDCLVIALEVVMPHWKGLIEVYEGEGDLLKTFMARDQRGQRANVIIRRQHVGPASNDIGFAALPDGTMDSIISDYDRGRKINGTYTGRYGTEWMDKVTREYSWALAQQQAEQLDRDIERFQDEDGTWLVKMTERGAQANPMTRLW